MRILFNDNWQFAELAIDEKLMYKDGNPVFFEPESFFEKAAGLSFAAVRVPHDWMITDTKNLYRSSVGFYRKKFNLDSLNELPHVALSFEGVYMNSAVWVNGKLAGKWKYGYSPFEFDISELVKSGENEVLVIAVYQNCNTRWYSGAGIFRDVHLINSSATHLVTDGVYFSAKPVDETKLDGEWKVKVSVEIVGQTDEICEIALRQAQGPQDGVPELVEGPKTEFTITAPHLWDITDPYCYKLTITLKDTAGNILDQHTQNCGFKYAKFTSDKGFFLNGRHVKIQGACQHHDLGALGSAFNAAALRRQFTKLKEMGVNAVRTSHNPPPRAWMDLCDQMGILVDSEAFDMWEKPKTQFDYGNYFNDWCERDVRAWVRHDRNHPSLIMWSIGNEIYDTHVGNGLEITKRLSKYVRQSDPEGNAPITIGSNYMMTEGAQKCAQLIDTVGYNYLERFYDEHHAKYPEWKIYGSETSSTVQSRGIYHFPDSLKLVTFSDGQCSTLGNCTTPWGAVNTQTVITTDRDCPFSAGQFIWTGWDYIGEPTPYHTKSSFFGQIDTAGFPKDTYYLYKSEWAGKNTEPFVHLLPYWDWNEGQLIDVKAYTNADEVELFFNGQSQGKQKINHKNGAEPFGRWQVEYHKGEIKAVAYDEEGCVVAEDIKKSFGDPAKIILEVEQDYNETGLPRFARNDEGGVRHCEERSDVAIHFIQVMLTDSNDTLVENARNYITLNITGDAELLGMDNGDSTDYDEYVAADGHTHTRKLFANRLIAIVKEKAGAGSSGFIVTAASQGLPNISIKYDGKEWNRVEADSSVLPQNSYVPVRKIELQAQGSLKLDPSNKEVLVTAKVLPQNATDKEINWNPVFKECIASDNIVVASAVPEPVEGPQPSRLIRAAGDGECLLRCTAQNNTKYDEVISDLPFTISGIGNTRLNPYTLIEACRFTDYDKSDNKAKPEMSLESGISNRKCGPTWVSFDKVDFGKDGADTIHLPIFSFATEFPIQVWDGKGTGPDSRLLGTYTYRHESIYNTYSENIFTLPRRLFGLHTITLSFETDLYLHGFYFDQSPKAYAKLCVLDANLITGDSFTKTSDAVEGIGNNVNIDFEDMDFGTAQTKDQISLTICGRSNSENNTINLKFFASDGSNKTYVIDFACTDDYEEKTFWLPAITGLQKVSFVFLPGCNFDFKWFRFNLV
ncbi:MAG: DUF4982 domain-containing protein [Treponema sp.]|nr:DUF4982 domain-containing protein [Treponema sp.]